MGKITHLIAAVLALIIGGLGLTWGIRYAEEQETRYVHALAPMLLGETQVGSALTKTALRQNDLLVVYGSSEMVMWDLSYRSHIFFQTYPTGFTVYNVGQAGITSLIMFEGLAAMGPDLTGRKVVISFTPSIFQSGPASQAAYAGNFSRIHAYSITFNPYLSLDLKRRAALRMLSYPATLEKDPLLKFGLEQISRKTDLNQAVYTLLFPLGYLQSQIIALQDHYQVLEYLLENPNIDPQVARQAAAIQWSALIKQTDEEPKTYATNNFYGVSDTVWNERFKDFRPSVMGEKDAAFTKNMRESGEWEDFDILLNVLKELKAEPLFLGRPFKGNLMEATGVSAKARQVYYDLVNKKVSQYQFPLVDFADHDQDIYFCIDQACHTSRKGWVYVNQALDAFFHNRIH